MLKLALTIAGALAFGPTDPPPPMPNGPGFVELAYVGPQDHVIPWIVIARPGNTLFYDKDFGGGFVEPTYYFDDFLPKSWVEVIEVDDNVFAASRRIIEATPCSTRSKRERFDTTLVTVRVPADTVVARCGMKLRASCAQTDSFRALFAAHALPVAAFDQRRRELDCDTRPS